ncbi:ATP-binding cassette domain-containing protein [Nocardia sp. NPDC088792]|uniref:ABC transporter ATP-binding protein n=1 Tax=Nocardia sp. NPDC088792 TaxID=3364332 RepID=UPI0037FC0DA3
MPSIALQRVCVGHGDTRLLADVDATFAAARCTAVVGPSGAGKTTLLRLLNRFGEPDSGRVLLDGQPLAELDVLDLRRRVGLVQQRPILLTDTVTEEVQVGQPLDAELIGELLVRAGLPGEFGARRCAELSGGEAQRVCLARALAVRPEVLLLDEPTSALDGDSAVAIAALIRTHVSDGGSVVLVSHDSAFVAEVADEVWTLAQGRLTRGATAREQQG